MKRFLLLAVLQFAVLVAFSQTWFDIGLKGGIGSSFMYNSQIFKNQDIVHKFKPGYTFGGKLGFNFIQEHQITFDVMKTTYNQAFTYTPADGPTGSENLREYTFGGLDMLVMYRTNRSGTYFEIGPQWSTYSTVKFSDNGSTAFTEENVSKMIKKSNFGMAVGFGGYIFGTDNFGVATGLRFNYMFNDMATAEGNDANFPILKDTGESNPTHNLGVLFVIEMNYDFGYLVSSRCGQRTKLFVF
ncbi:MAG: outer membrane beta-barrel protein [Bacteroidales bacterium]|nr:outer membrane beta-barrel protein [Bacteroidales bacterium]MBK9359520.1 outer membrane beta-barrel protein [Bacteroidales bacterium]